MGIIKMNVSQLREALEEAVGILAAAGGHDDEEVSEFLCELRHRLIQPRTTTGRSQKQPDDLAVARYVQRLRDAGTDKIEFDGIVSELTKDKAIHKEEMDAIAHEYTQGRSQWQKKSDALKEIKTRFSERAYQAAKMMQVDKASRW